MREIKGEWKTYAQCCCGWMYYCPFGELFHLVYDARHIEICPSCGRLKDKSMKIVIAREIYIKERWYIPKYFDRYELKES